MKVINILSPELKETRMRKLNINRTHYRNKEAEGGIDIVRKSSRY